MKNFDLFSLVIQTIITEPEHKTSVRHYRKWKQQVPKDTPESELEHTMRSYVCSHLPAKDQCPISFIAPNCDMQRMEQWLKANDFPYFDTLCGLYVDQCETEPISRQLFSVSPLPPLFYGFCEDMSLAVAHSDYYNFKSKLPSRYYQKTSKHPLYPESRELYELCHEEAILCHIRKWCIIRKSGMPATVAGYLSLAETAEKWEVPVDDALDWLEVHPQESIELHAQLMIQQEFVIEIVGRKKSTVPLADLIEQVLYEKKTWRRGWAKNFLTEKLLNKNFCWLVNETDVPGTKPLQYVWEQHKQSAQECLEAFLEDYPQKPLRDLVPITQLPLSQLQDLAVRGCINAELITDKYYLSNAEYKNICRLCTEYIALDDVVTDILQNQTSLFNIMLPSHRTDLTDYLKQHRNVMEILENAVADIPINSMQLGYVLLRKNAPIVKNQCTLWLRGYKRSLSEKIDILLEKIGEKYPKTAKEVEVFLGDGLHRKPVLDMLDALLVCLQKVKKEMSELSEDVIEDIFVSEFCSKSIKCASLFSEFIYSAGYSSKRYQFDNTGYHYDVSAYPLENYAVIVASIVNDEFWDKNQLIEKAVNDSRMASLWLYISLHIFAAWRSTDYIRLQAPLLKYPPEKTLQHIKNGTFSDEDAKYTTETFLARVEARRMHPNKTKHVQGTPPLYFFCPESCRVPWGKILAIAAAHQQLSGREAFVQPIQDIYGIMRFFGPEMVAACAGKNFSGRRANKALMQSVELCSQNGGNSSANTAYVLASLVRAHKSTYGTLAETTARYLRDANFSGYTPEFIAWQMMERGVCSFVVDKLLSEGFGDRYRLLPVSDKTGVIQSVGLPTAHLDNIVRYTQQAENEAIEALKAVMNKSPNTGAADVLRTIIHGGAQGKQEDSLCLCRAANVPCQELLRSDCLGCRFEIKSKAVLLQYLNNYLRLHETACDGSGKYSDMERNRAIWILKNRVNPAVAEIMTFLKGTVSKEEFEMYVSIIKERMQTNAAE